MIISLSGKKRAGKSSCAEHLVSLGWDEVSWAYPLKEVIGRQLFGLTDEQMYGDAEAKEATLPAWGMSARQILQVVGTDLFRKHICDDFWVRIGVRRILELQPRNIVISDTRFPNEAQAVRAMGGTTICVEKIRTDGLTPPLDTHPSETALDDFNFDHRIIAFQGDMVGLRRQLMDIIGEK